MRIHVHIERLILDGLELGPGDGLRVQAAVEAELARLIAAGTVGQDGEAGRTADPIAQAWPTGGAIPRVAAPGIHVERGARPAQIGAQIAGSVYGGIGGQR